MEDKLDNNIDPLFWLPTDFLSDNEDDIFIGQDNLNLTSNTQLPPHFPYDFTELNRPFASENKWALSRSPQSILSPVLSNGSPNGPSSPTAPFTRKQDQSWNLICAAAGEVNMWKMKNETANKNRALPTPHNIFTHHVKQNNGSVWGGVSAEFVCGFSRNARCRRAQSPFQCGWPALPIRNQHFYVNGRVSHPSSIFAGGMRNVAGGGVGLNKKCAGTGVFLPRTCPDTAPSPVKPETMRRNAGLGKWHNAMNMMGNRAMNCKMLLPEEWSY
ncbi:uncharacterized protein LOC141701682 isoform X2 [Apium graveolens]|uniref:uncharacterized protein LOC141701682 isoform X2 n=1 Tax=Apium graveolens TaxID=4045 RepID=UPI003D7A4BE0